MLLYSVHPGKFGLFKVFKAKETANTVENIAHLRTFRPSVGAIINACML